MTTPYRGSCLCGEIVFEADAFSADAAHCHCSMCRKFHGAEYATFASIPRAAFHFVQGEGNVTNYTAHNGTIRSFCPRCGSSLFFQSPQGDPTVVEVALAAFDDAVPLSPSARIFFGSRANWTKSFDDLPKFSKGRGSRSEES